MTKSLSALIAISVLLVFSLYGCASKPEQELAAATEAMNQAAELRAELYVPGDWKAAMELWDQAQDQLTKGQFALAKATLPRAKARFVKARDNAKVQRESMLQQVKDFQTSVGIHYDAFKSNKTVSANKKDFQAACDDIDKRIAIVKDAVDKSDYITAKREAQNTLAAIEFNQKKLGGGATQAGK